MFASGTAWALLGSGNASWRVYAAVAAAPATLTFFLVLLTPYAPETPRFLSVRGEHEKAADTLRFIAKVNRTHWLRHLLPAPMTSSSSSSSSSLSSSVSVSTVVNDSGDDVENGSGNNDASNSALDRRLERFVRAAKARDAAAATAAAAASDATFDDNNRNESVGGGGSGGGACRGAFSACRRLFAPQLARTTIVLCVTWFVCRREGVWFCAFDSLRRQCVDSFLFQCFSLINHTQLCNFCIDAAFHNRHFRLVPTASMFGFLLFFNVSASTVTGSQKAFTSLRPRCQVSFRRYRHYLLFI
jgi:hypothetical protein